MNNRSFFLCIGAQRSGTSWLHRNLSRQPLCWLPPHKELHYFDSLYVEGHRAFFRERRLANLKQVAAALEPAQATDADIQRLRWYARFALAEHLDDAWYQSLFPTNGPWEACGEITPAYSMLPARGFEHLARLYPDVRILFIMRNPIDRVWSQIRFYADFFSDPTLMEPEKALAFS